MSPYNSFRWLHYKSAAKKVKHFGGKFRFLSVDPQPWRGGHSTNPNGLLIHACRVLHRAEMLLRTGNWTLTILNGRPKVPSIDGNN
jgi:hypothetical protein